MSQYPYQPPNPYDPSLNYATPGAIRGSARPTSVTALSITAIVIGSLWLLCNVVGIGNNAIMINNGGRNPMAPQLPPMDPLVVKVGIVNAVVGLFLSAAMLVGAITALRLRPAGRQIMIIWSGLDLLWIVAVTVMQILIIQPATQHWLTNAQPNNPFGAMMSGFGTPIAIASAVVYAILPVLILIFWNTPGVKAAFTPGAAILPQPPSPQWPPHGQGR